MLHCLEVAALVAGVGGSTPMISAAVLHDVVEDTSASNEDVCQLFGPEIAAGVAWLTDASTSADGNRVILMLEAHHTHATEIVSGFGQLGVPAERLAKTTAARMNGYLEALAYAGPYLADQLILPFVLAGGGSFTTVKPSQHVLTAIDIATRFTGLQIELSQQPDGAHLIAVG